MGATIMVKALDAGDSTEIVRAPKVLKDWNAKMEKEGKPQMHPDEGCPEAGDAAQKAGTHDAEGPAEGRGVPERVGVGCRAGVSCSPGLYLRLAILLDRCLANVWVEKVHVARRTLNFFGYF